MGSSGLSRLKRRPSWSARQEGQPVPVAARRAAALVVAHNAHRGAGPPVLPAVPPAWFCDQSQQPPRSGRIGGARLVHLDVLGPAEARECWPRVAARCRYRVGGSRRRDGGLPGCAAASPGRCGSRPPSLPRPHLSIASWQTPHDEQHRLRSLATGDVGVAASFTLSYQNWSPAARISAGWGSSPCQFLPAAWQPRSWMSRPEEAERCWRPWWTPPSGSRHEARPLRSPIASLLRTARPSRGERWSMDGSGGLRPASRRWASTRVSSNRFASSGVTSMSRLPRRGQNWHGDEPQPAEHPGGRGFQVLIGEGEAGSHAHRRRSQAGGGGAARR